MPQVYKSYRLLASLYRKYMHFNRKSKKSVKKEDVYQDIYHHFDLYGQIKTLAVLLKATINLHGKKIKST